MENHTQQKRLGRGMLTIGWIVALTLLSMYFAKWQDNRENPNQMPSGSSADGVHELVLEKNYQHHYVVNGQINGQTVTFLVDTGATHVSVPAHLANQLKLKPGARGMAVTANGTVEVRATRINHLTLGPINLVDVPASINPGMKDNAVLLGMSALKNVEFTHRNGTLTLKQYY